MSRNTHIFSRYLHEEGIRSAGTGMFARIATLSERAPSPPSCLGARGRAAAAGGAGLGPARRGSRHRGASERAGHAARGVWGARAPWTGAHRDSTQGERQDGHVRTRGEERRGPRGKYSADPSTLAFWPAGLPLGPPGAHRAGRQGLSPRSRPRLQGREPPCR